MAFFFNRNLCFTDNLCLRRFYYPLTIFSKFNLLIKRFFKYLFHFKKPYLLFLKYCPKVQ